MSLNHLVWEFFCKCLNHENSFFEFVVRRILVAKILIGISSYQKMQMNFNLIVKNPYITSHANFFLNVASILQ